MNRTGLKERAIGTLLGAAVGDALGWPQEQNAANVGFQRGEKPNPQLRFRAWTRLSGGRFYPHHEEIGSGEYSDDTQLILATARSLLRGNDWVQWLTTVELPLLSLYERGAGRAIKRASSSWLRNRSPWTTPKRDQVTAYFNAGGNGAAMRVTPHCLSPSESGAQESLKDVLLNAVCSHGHPRALIGATVQAFAVTSLLGRRETLGYGELVDEIRLSSEVWGAAELLDHLPESWTEQFTKGLGKTPEEVWTQTVSEMIDLLEIVSGGLSAGSLGDDEATLRALGCFDKRVNGAGTVSAAAALLLASKSAANPAAGLHNAAFLQDTDTDTDADADTDTVASMTGSLLGALRGTDWLGDLGGSVQDADYFGSLVEAILGHARPPITTLPDRITQSRLDRFTSELEEADDRGEIWVGTLPDGREARVLAPLKAESLSPKLAVRGWSIAVEDGQSIFVKKLKRIQVARKSERSVKVERVGAKILAADLLESRRFYEEILGLEPARKESQLVNYHEVLTIVPTIPSRFD